MAKSDKNLVRVGCCGFGMAQSKYLQTFSTVEVQQTFYQPPQTSTLKKWRETAGTEFDFAIKAWQLITHTAKSPTYRRLKRELNDTELKQAGNFQLTKIVKEAWQVTLESSNALQASHILFQCPASFTPTEKNLKNMHTFFRWIDRPENCIICWEPRGKQWTSQIVTSLCDELNICHAVDPFVTNTVTPEHLYYRLHGRTGWRHNFTDDELVVLKNLTPVNTSGRVFFNNVTMVEDAMKFDILLQQKL